MSYKQIRNIAEIAISFVLLIGIVVTVLAFVLVNNNLAMIDASILLAIQTTVENAV